MLAIGKTEGSTVSGGIVETFAGIIGLVDINIRRICAKEGILWWKS